MLDRGQWVYGSEKVYRIVHMNDGNVPYKIRLMQFLINISKRHYTCDRPPGAAGAMIVTPGFYIFAGVMPADGSPTCKESGCMLEYSHMEGESHFHPHCVRTIHAEQRAICLAARAGIPLEGSTLYSVLKPCFHCSKLIIATGISKIYYAGYAYDEQRTRDILERANVNIERLEVGLEYGK